MAGGPHNECCSVSLHAPYIRAKDSPTCANYALQREARGNVSQYPEAIKAVLENFYMNDYLDSVESPERAIKWSKELVHLLHLGGIKLTKFVSNAPNLVDQIDGHLSPQYQK